MVTSNTSLDLTRLHVKSTQILRFAAIDQYRGGPAHSDQLGPAVRFPAGQSSHYIGELMRMRYLTCRLE